MSALVAWIACYLVGGIPFGFLVAKAKGIDITQQGSGNIGATNVGRVIGKKAYFLVLFLDILKGAVPGLVLPILIPATFGLTSGIIGLVGGISAVVGHIFSPYLKFKGGKGIATGLGMLVGSMPIVAAIVLAVWIVAFAISRLVSLASLFATVAMVVATVCLYPLTNNSQHLPYWIVASGLAVFIFLKHRANITRIINKTEPKFTFSKSSVEKPTSENSSEAPPEPGGEA